MTRLFLAAGVAALAIASPAAAAKPGGGHGGGNQAAAQQHGKGGSGQRAQAVQRGGGGGQRAQAVQRGGGGGHAMRAQRQQGFAKAERQQHQRIAQPRQERQQAMRMAQPRKIERQQAHAQRVQMAKHDMQRQEARAQSVKQMRDERRFEQARNRGAERQQLRAQRVEQARNRGFERQQLRAQRNEQAQNRAFVRQNLRGKDMRQLQRQAMIGGERFADRRALRTRDWKLDRNQQLAFQQNWNTSRFAGLDFGDRLRVAPINQVVRYVGMPVTTVAGFGGLSALPAAVSYLYPETPNYYYRYGNGYLYQVDRGDNLISALLPLIAGGYMPGQYLPQPYMASYVPTNYGFNSFYPDYGDTCNRYANGVVYEVDCYSGLVEDVIPLYASGYGVGQILPSSYAYYNVPSQYRNMYYDTSDYGYWYAPGAIYQYEPRSSMITSVAALLSPGFTVGQPLPTGYDVYNVPYAYRTSYYDTPNAWYRYNNGYIYQVDPTTQLVTAIVASLLT